MWGLHPNDIFFQDSQVKFLLSQNFGYLYIFQIKLVWNMQGKYFIVLKKIFPMVYWHTPIKAYLALALKGFVVGSEIFNLNFNPSFYYNSCISGVNEQCKGILSSYILKHFQWYFGGRNWCLFTFSTKAFEYIPT
jgi:hypothetical protein